ncbi:MAG TPA: hypothetical protein VLY24_23315 [Bryobacteraceae bacterium]|nr:hypothetical protein [Bryobacteraceae bacterium]
MRAIATFLAGTACALLLAVSLPAASAPGSNSDQKATAEAQREWPAEMLSGRIMMVDPNQKLVVVQTPDGVPFDMVVTSKTRIESGDQAMTFKDLSNDVNKNVSVRFRPEGRGDIARSIQING